MPSRRWLALLTGPLLWGCAGVADYSTAKMLPRGGFEVAPHATGFGVSIPEDLQADHSWQIWSAGGMAGYGITNELSVFADYEYSRFGYSDPDVDALDHRLALAIKYGWEPLREAFSLAYGYHPEWHIHDLNAASYSNWYWKRSLYYCLSPSVNFFSNDPGRENVWALNVVINQSVTWEFGRHFYLRPQVGFNFMGLFARIFIVNAGLAGGLAF